VLKTFVKRGVQPSNAPFIMQNRDRVIAVAIGATVPWVIRTHFPRSRPLPARGYE
jgi:hypothetical protein